VNVRSVGCAAERRADRSWKKRSSSAAGGKSYLCVTYRLPVWSSLARSGGLTAGRLAQPTQSFHPNADRRFARYPHSTATSEFLHPAILSRKGITTRRRSFVTRACAQREEKVHRLLSPVLVSSHPPPCPARRRYYCRRMLRRRTYIAMRAVVGSAFFGLRSL
jgi:hypothetical protein